jgi:photosystem II stability/assembly factor-like uncharacterized protein
MNRLYFLFFAFSFSTWIGCHDIHLDYTESPGEITVFDDLYSVSATDDKNAVAVGYYGSAYFTRDGGESWKRGVTGTMSSLYNVSMASPEVGWAIGQRGLILRTEDGGETWQRQANLKEDEGAHLFSVAAIDEDTALAIGEWGTRIRTEDGGKTWVDNSFTVDEAHSMFQWLSPVEQERVRAGETVYEDVSLNDIYCLGAPSKRCWLIGEFGYIFFSEDEGRTWLPSSINGTSEIEPIQLGYNEIEFDAVYEPALREFAQGISSDAHLNVAIEGLASAEEIQTLGRDGDPYEFFELLEARMQEVRSVLEDAGLESERVRLRGQPPWDYEEYLDDDPEFLERYYASRLHPNPGVKARIIQNPILFTVRFRDEDNGMISGLGGLTLYTEDGGKTWSYSNIDRTLAVFSIASVPGKVVAVGEKGLVRISEDNGRNWRPPEDGEFPRIFTFMRDIAFAPNGDVGYVVGQTGQIMKTDDQGQAWRVVLPNS